MKIDKKFQEELKLANLEKEELIVNLDESDKKNEFLRNRFSKSLEQELVESKAELKKLSCTKPAIIDDRSISFSIKPKDEKVYIPPFKRNYKKKKKLLILLGKTKVKILM